MNIPKTLFAIGAALTLSIVFAPINALAKDTNRIVLSTSNAQKTKKIKSGDSNVIGMKFTATNKTNEAVNISSITAELDTTLGTDLSDLVAGIFVDGVQVANSQKFFQKTDTPKKGSAIFPDMAVIIPKKAKKKRSNKINFTILVNSKSSNANGQARLSVTGMTAKKKQNQENVDVYAKKQKLGILVNEITNLKDVNCEIISSIQAFSINQLCGPTINIFATKDTQPENKISIQNYLNAPQQINPGDKNVQLLGIKITANEPLLFERLVLETDSPYFIDQNKDGIPNTIEDLNQVFSNIRFLINGKYHVAVQDNFTGATTNSADTAQLIFDTSFDLSEESFITILADVNNQVNIPTTPNSKNLFGLKLSPQNWDASAAELISTGDPVLSTKTNLSNYNEIKRYSEMQQ